MVLAILLTVLAAAAVAHALIGSVRRRSRTFGTLQALGFTPRQVRLTIAWQATTIAAVATLIGVPLGIIGGRQAWRAIADRIGVVDHPIMPWTLILLALPLTVIITNLVAALPGRAAARQAPAQALRDE
jgi:putative ABC transport system permease protein